MTSASDSSKIIILQGTKPKESSKLALPKVPKDEKREKIMKELLSLEINSKCADCGDSNPTHASLLVPPEGKAPSSGYDEKILIGLFCCEKCSVFHRDLGTDVVASVKSVVIDLDSWTEEELDAMERGGNEIVNSIYEGAASGNKNLTFMLSFTKPSPGDDDEKRERFIRDKYEKHKFFLSDAYNNYVLRKHHHEHNEYDDDILESSDSDSSMEFDGIFNRVSMSCKSETSIDPPVYSDEVDVSFPRHRSIRRNSTTMNCMSQSLHVEAKRRSSQTTKFSQSFREPRESQQERHFQRRSSIEQCHRRRRSSISSKSVERETAVRDDSNNSSSDMKRRSSRNLKTPTRRDNSERRSSIKMAERRSSRRLSLSSSTNHIQQRKQQENEHENSRPNRSRRGSLNLVDTNIKQQRSFRSISTKIHHDSDNKTRVQRTKSFQMKPRSSRRMSSNCIINNNTDDNIDYLNTTTLGSNRTEENYYHVVEYVAKLAS